MANDAIPTTVRKGVMVFATIVVAWIGYAMKKLGRLYYGLIEMGLESLSRRWRSALDDATDQAFSSDLQRLRSVYHWRRFGPYDTRAA